MSIVLLALAVLAFLLSLFLRNHAAVCPGEVVYRDTDDEHTLVSDRYRLVGRPDYITREKRGLVPVEVKSRACGPRGPYPGERAQLLAYCLLAEEEFGGRVAHSVLQYRDRSVTVPFNDRERRAITALLAEMNAAREAHRSHQQPGRCRGCGFRGQCSEALT